MWPAGRDGRPESMLIRLPPSRLRTVRLATPTAGGTTADRAGLAVLLGGVRSCRGVASYPVGGFSAMNQAPSAQEIATIGASLRAWPGCVTAVIVSRVVAAAADSWSRSARARDACAGANVSQNLVESTIARRSAASAATVTRPARHIRRLLSSPWPGSGSNITTGSPAPNASSQVRPPAFWMSTSLAAISSDMRWVNPRMVTGATASSRLRARPKALVSTRDDDRVGVRHRGDGVAGAAQVSDAPRSAHDQGHPRAGGDTELGPDTLADARVGRYGRDWRPDWRVGRARLADYQVCVEILLHPGGVGVKVGHKGCARPR